MTQSLFAQLSSICRLGRARTADKQPETDALTGLPNRRHFLRVADERLAEVARHPKCCAILLIDLDQLKLVNDTHGHEAGDAVLVAVAQRLALELPVAHCAARLGDDEFAVLLGPDADLKIEYCAEQIAGRVARPIIFAGREIRVSACIGIALSPNDCVTAAGLIARAGERMARRKRSLIAVAA